MKISDKNEGTAYPFWTIIDPHQNFSKGRQGLHNIAGMITGVWFSREAAEEYLENHRYNFGVGARVYCHSGCYSGDWMELTNELKKQEAAPELLEACLTAKAMYEAQGINENSRIGGNQYKQLLEAIKKATE